MRVGVPVAVVFEIALLTVIFPDPAALVLLQVALLQVWVVAVVVIETLVPAFKEVSIVPAVVALIVTSVGSINHIPPLPALILDNRLIIWPEVSI